VIYINYLFVGGRGEELIRMCQVANNNKKGSKALHKCTKRGEGEKLIRKYFNLTIRELEAAENEQNLVCNLGSFLLKLFGLSGFGALHRPTKEQNVRLGLVDHVVNPALRLLHAEGSPFLLRHQVSLGHEFDQIFGQHHMPVLKRIVVILVGIIKILRRHYAAVFVVDFLLLQICCFAAKTQPPNSHLKLEKVALRGKS